ncbi:MAG: histone deacetylase [Methanomicrobiaceae archaeon]|nr:histone deacetylase [Methanomicrobiaceae archaeon]
MKSSVITSGIFADHNDPGHPESNDRLVLALSGVPAGVKRIEAKPAAAEDLVRIHTPEHIAGIRALSSRCGQGRPCYLDPDTYVTSRSFEAAAAAAGAACMALERAESGEHCFALVRPPGHHAMPSRAMGFCLFNNVAIAVAGALKHLNRIAIVDWDVHHGNGTQAIFYGSDRVLYCSVHEMGNFPGTGWPAERGAGSGIGYTINAPLERRSGAADYRLVFEEVFLPAIDAFGPDLLVISAGQDTLFDDPLGSMALYPADYGAMTRMIMEAADLGVALVLEGGYSPSHGEAIAWIFRALSGDAVEWSAGAPKEHTRALCRLLCGSEEIPPV